MSVSIKKQKGPVPKSGLKGVSQSRKGSSKFRAIYYIDRNNQILIGSGYNSKESAEEDQKLFTKFFTEYIKNNKDFDIRSLKQKNNKDYIRQLFKDYKNKISTKLNKLINASAIIEKKFSISPGNAYSNSTISALTNNHSYTHLNSIVSSRSRTSSKLSNNRSSMNISKTHHKRTINSIGNSNNKPKTALNLLVSAALHIDKSKKIKVNNSIRNKMQSS